MKAWKTWAGATGCRPAGGGRGQGRRRRARLHARPPLFMTNHPNLAGEPASAVRRTERSPDMPC